MRANFSATLRYVLLAIAAAACATPASATVITAFHNDFSFVAGLNFTNQEVAIFEDDNPSAYLTDFTATIDWGDGSPVSPGTIGISDTEFPVLGSHTYASIGTFTVTVVIADVSPGTGTAIATSIATGTETVTPEPSSAALVGIGLASLGLLTRRAARRC